LKAAFKAKVLYPESEFFDDLFSKDAIHHHILRPEMTIYEMLRVARKGILSLCLNTKSLIGL
jgi:hypothetical protein